VQRRPGRASTVTASAVAVAWTLWSGAPALAQESASGAKPWHYWIAPLLLGAGLLVIAGFALGYWIRVVGGRGRH
jgi:hypothetical protein